MKFKFKSFSGDKNDRAETSPTNPSDSQERRKAQIRRAQKTHRERKQEYTKSLEVEVVQLRANEAKIMQETKALYAELSALKRLLAVNGIPLPEPGSQAYSAISQDVTSPEQTFNLSIQFTSTKRKQQQISAQRSASHHHQYRHERSTGAANTHLVETIESSSFSHTFSNSETSSPQVDLVMRNIPPVRLGDCDLTAIGMEFVLSLESPCLPHIVPTEQEAATGHALTISASLLHQHPARPEQRLRANQPSWQVPAVSIERLLQLSNSISLAAGELTPVQAWDLLRKHPELGDLTMERFVRLQEKLLKVVNCYGFGGVIDKDIFDNAIFEAFVVGRVF